MRGKIALEEHVSTPENNRLWDSSGEAGRNGTEYMKDVERRLLDRSIQLEEMAQRHIDHVILSLTSPGAQSILDKAKAVSFARETNDFIVENYVKPNPDKFSAFATLALQNPEAAAEELERAVKKLGMKGALINGYTKGDWWEAALFALSVAVGLTPEMLPMIVTSTLARGAVKLSKQKVIVKHLDAIQNFGAMDILCTDKTGTLTQDKIVLENHTDISESNTDLLLIFQLFGKL